MSSSPVESIYLPLARQDAVSLSVNATEICYLDVLALGPSMVRSDDIFLSIDIKWNPIHVLCHAYETQNIRRMRSFTPSLSNKILLHASIP